jgi:hypothetical protein
VTSGETSEKVTKPKHRFNSENAAELGRKGGEAAARNRASRGGSTAKPSDEELVIAGLQRAAEKGSAPAARELREWLARRKEGGDELATLVVKQPQDMTPAERERLRAYLLRRFAVREARAAFLARRAEHEQASSTAGAEVGHGTPPEEGTPAL